MKSKAQYWFADPDPKQVVKHLDANMALWSTQTSNPICQAWIRNQIAYYSTILEATDWQTSLSAAGDQGELVKMVLPNARSIIRQIVTLVTKQRLSFTAIADSGGADVTEDMRIANAVITDTIKEQDLDRLAQFVVEQACVLGTAFYKVAWRTDKGRPYLARPNESDAPSVSMSLVDYDGQIEITAPNVYDVTFDPRIEREIDRSWLKVRQKVNRYDMIAQFPELEAQILCIPPVQIDDQSGVGRSEIIETDDLIYVHEAYHKPSPALPEGRMIMFGDDKTIFYDGPNEYGCIPVIKVCPEAIFGMSYGYPIISNLLPAQEMFDHSLSAIATNQSGFAVQDVLCPRNADINSESIGGKNWIFYTPANAEGGGKPEALQLSASSPDTFKFAAELNNYMTQISNLNSTIRGTPPPGLTSGTAIATMSANALEFMNGLAMANDLALESVMFMVIEFSKKFAVVPRPVTITGKNNQTTSKNYTGKNLEIIKKISINRTNPLMATLAGRSDIADKLMQQGLIKDTQQYFSIIEGAPKENLYKIELSENDLMEAENDALLEGQEVRAIATDDHPQHIRQHNSLLNSVAVRFDQDKTSRILEHIMEHYQLAQSTDPMLMAMVRTGQMPQGGPAPQAAGGDQGGPVIPEDGAPIDVAEPTDDQLGRAM